MAQPIAIFIHIALLNGWYERVNHYLLLIQKSGLLDITTTIFLSFVGDIPISELLFSSDIMEKIKVIRSSNDLNEYEIPTQQLLFNFCSNNKEYNVLYIHTKGVGKELNPCIEDWIEYILYFLIEQHTLALERLITHNSVGVDLRDLPTLHYSGNFWWTKASYIITLPPPCEFKNINKYPNPLNSERHNQEFWICYFKTEHFNLWDCGINCYQRHLHRYPRYIYSK